MKNLTRSTPAPPAWIVKIVDYILARQAEKRSWGIGTTYDIRKAFGEAAWYIFAFWFAGTPWRPMLAVIIAGCAALRLRDWRIHPAKGTLAEAATDGLMAGAVIAVSQLCLVRLYPSFATPHATDLIHGIGISLPLVAGWRQMFHVLTPKNDPQQEPEFRLFRASLRVNAMWAIAIWAIMGTNIRAVPGGHLRDFLLAWMAILSQGIVRRLADKSGLSSFWEEFGKYSISTDPLTEELEAKSEALPVLAQITPGMWFFIVAFLVSASAPTAIALERWFHGTATDIRWSQLWTNDIGLLILIPMWRVIAYLNAATSDAMKRRILARKKELGRGLGA